MCIESSWNICLLFGEMPPRPFEGNLRYLRLLLLETVKCNDTQSARDIFATFVRKPNSPLLKMNCTYQTQELFFVIHSFSLLTFQINQLNCSKF